MNLTAWLDAALANFVANGAQPDSPQWLFVLATPMAPLTLESLCAIPVAGHWRIRPIDQPQGRYALAEQTNGTRIGLLLGEQWNTTDGLEMVVADTGTALQHHRKLAAAEFLEAHPEASCIIPWAVGKWLGHRGRILDQLLAQYSSRIVLGDNGGRPRWFPARHLRLARHRQWPVLPGTDPLPVNQDWRRVGSFGLRSKAQCSQNTEAALSWVQQLLAGQVSAQDLEPFGRLMPTTHFLLNQFRLLCAK